MLPIWAISTLERPAQAEFTSHTAHQDVLASGGGVAHVRSISGTSRLS